LQAARANAALARGADALATLSPRQRVLAGRVAAAIANDPDALSDLACPERVLDLPAYELVLRARLDGAAPLGRR
jgi:hypothetical protein